ncbi:MAG TPA: alpha/beta hydrolase [Allosphingosinicella sp.]|nr:alpha/beta hydrolase [Allosphingosinicella sp.]
MSTTFERQEIDVAGVNTIVYTIGEGAPLVFMHGAGTSLGREFVRPWAEKRRVIFPYHPNFGESGDDNSIQEVSDYVLHYLDLFDALGLETFDLVGHSLGGWLAAEFAIRHPERLNRLVLVSPAGLVVPEVESPDYFMIHENDMPGYLMMDPSRLAPYLPAAPDVDFLTLSYRETTATARVVWDHPSGNRKLGRWLHRIKVPTLLLWGEHDRLQPTAKAAAWQAALPNAELKLVPNAGHLVFEEQPDSLDIVSRFLD